MSVRDTEIKQLPTAQMYALPLHESMMVSEKLEIVRVPGGWLYNYFFAGMTVTTTFIKEVFFEG